MTAIDDLCIEIEYIDHQDLDCCENCNHALMRRADGVITCELYPDLCVNNLSICNKFIK